jgi:hypothetical protein
MLKSVHANDREASLLMPLATCLSAFLVIRGVFGQGDIHPIIFMVVGMTIALVARDNAQTAAQTQVTQKPAPARPGSRKRS